MPGRDATVFATGFNAVQMLSRMADLAPLASVINGNVVFDFGDGNTLTLANIALVGSIMDDITLI